jgi:LysM repeat protein
MRFIKALAAIAVLVAVLMVPPWALITLIGNPWPAEGVSLSAPLTDSAIVGLLAVVVWVLWLQLVGCVVVEAIAAVTDDRIQLRMPLTLGVQQQFARRLVTAVVVATVPVSVAVGAGSTMTAPDSASAAGPVVQTAQQSSHGVEDQPAVKAEQESPAKTTSVLVKRLDTLWDIAERMLGDGDRWPEIAALNEGRKMNDGTVFTSADQIRPGWELLVPDEHREDGEWAEHTVKAGDTITGIALKEYGDADRWSDIYEANKDIIGANPDLIHPGQVLAVPAHVAADDSAPPDTEDSADEQAGRQPRADQPTVPGTKDSESSAGPRGQGEPQRPEAPATVQGQSTEGSSSTTEQGPAATADEQQDDDGGISALRALLASAVCLSVGALGLVTANRRRQFRRRRIGRAIASTPQDLAEVEQAIVEHGSEAQEDVEFLDRALRHVAACCRAASQPLPQLGAAVLGAEDLTLLFTHPAVSGVPEGWTATDDARAWMLPRWTVLAEDLETQAAPYPALVTIGHDGGGRTWLLDLETLGVCGIGGEPEQVADLARFMVAELAVNAWSEGSEVLLADQFASETIGLNPARLQQVDRSDALARATLLTSEMGEVEQNLDADVLTRRRDGLLLDTTNPVVIVVASRPEGEFVTDLDDRDRSRVVVVHGEEESPAVELTGDGMAFLPRWGISVKAFTLPPAEAEAMAALLTSTRNVEDEPVPATESDDGPLGKYARVDGSLREEYTEPRHTGGNDRSSLLPEADEVYVATAATTPADMAAVAPSVSDEIRAEIEAIDPTLDQDLADWYDESSPRPKIRLLGPVDVTSLNGGDPAVINNLAGTISFIAYLACQERGVTGERAADAFGWKTQKTVQNRATNARYLLGTRPDGGDWLPDASTSDGARRGTPTYGLVKGPGGVLVNIDLFVRLRFRAQKRGDDGCEQDLVTALSLVEGAPFEAATDRRFPWLFQGQRHDNIMVAAVHDLAHVLATRAAAAGRADLVRLACEAARKASPQSDVAWLDLAAATEAESGREAADELVREQVVDRFDEDLPPRTEVVLDQRDWLTG